MRSPRGTGTAGRCRTWTLPSSNASGCCRVAGRRLIPSESLRVPQRISEKQFNRLLAFCSPTKLHIVLTCLRHQIPTLTSLERTPAFISSHSASITEHLRCGRRGAAPSLRLCFPSLRGRPGCRLRRCSSPRSCRALGNFTFSAANRRLKSRQEARVAVGRLQQHRLDGPDHFPGGTSAAKQLNALQEGFLLRNSPQNCSNILSRGIRGAR